MKISSCPSCGAPVPPTAEQCPYCRQYFIRDGDETTQQTHAAGGSETLAGITFRRVAEPNEKAFTFALPHGWQVEGGIQRANLTRQMIDAQSIAAKLDLTVKRDAEGSVSLRWCPEIRYCDMRMSPAGMMGIFPPGSNYQGMLVYPLMSATEFLIRMVFPWAYPQMQEVQVVERRAEPSLVQAYRERNAAFGVPTNFDCDGGVVVFTCTEGGRRFDVVAMTVIESLGRMGGGMWSNKDTLLLRTPSGEFETWSPILRHIATSIDLNHEWVAREVVSQEFLSRSFLNAQQASMARDRRMLEVQRQLQDIDRQITEHRMRTNAEIHNDAYLTLMCQEEYINPYTQEPEIGSNQWQYRWVTEGGEEFYTDNEDADPNIAGLFNCTDWRRTPIRPRYNG